MSIYFYVAIYVAAVVILLAAAFVEHRGFRTLAAISGASAIWLPYLILKMSLGLPNPHAPPGQFRLIGWHVDAPKETAYLLVERLDQDAVPMLYGMPYAKEDFNEAIDDSVDPRQARYITMEEDSGGFLRLRKRKPPSNDALKDNYYREHPTPNGGSPR
ncbi:MAG: hypothetical protein IID61_11860 [SAR324 cluster bacterium]|nr:hypothetical protein [SAR324 cluster bacterium]